MTDHRGGSRDTISIAFTQSQYPTPYTDQTIPGSTPGHRLRHLGRQHQPLDILYNHLSHALVAHGDGDVYGNTARCPAPPGGNYVLHNKNGGKRHFDELSGMGSEQPWQPSKRIVFPLRDGETSDGQRRVVPQRRGRGVYNADDGFLHPDAEAAIQQREQAEVRRREHGGKARVGGPRDHKLADLGMVQQEQQAAPPKHGSSPCASLLAPQGSSQIVDGVLHSSKSSSNVKDGLPEAAADAVELRAYNGQSLLPSCGPNVPPARGSAAEADAVAEYHRNQRMRVVLGHRKETVAASATRAADAQSVRELPNW